MRILLTGAAGFIGMHVAERLLRRGDEVVGLDNLNAYYDVRLKEDRIVRLERWPGFRLLRIDVADAAGVARAFAEVRPERVIHLAAQAGVRYSIENPRAFGDSNLTGFLNILEGCRSSGVSHLVFASSSSVYGGNTRMPFSVHHNVDHPLSLYAATKKANELMAHTYSHLFGIPSTGLRFFTVFGPWGRPDMAPFIFCRSILAGRPIEVFNHGQNRRDFTFVDDIAEGVVRVCDRPATPDPAWSGDSPDPATSRAPYRIYNIGNNTPVGVLEFISLLEQHLGRTTGKIMLPAQPGDVEATWADVADLSRDVGFQPSTPLGAGVASFVAWYLERYAGKPDRT